MAYTCITCRVVFNTPEIQRNHYKSEWHRYNLKRKVAELPPVGEEQFLAKEAGQKSLEETKQSLSSYCQVCRKYFSSENALRAHQNSKKHRSKLENAHVSVDKNFSQGIRKSVTTRQEVCNNNSEEEVADDDEWESCDDEAESVVEEVIDVCPFCTYRCSDVDAVVRHMALRHSFFIPDPEYVIDLPGLLSYLNRKVTEYQTCPWCQRSFGSAESVRRHVADSGHAKILHEGEHLLEYEDFYDYSSSYPGQGGDGTEDPSCLDDGGWELVLPSGARVGHRLLARYYRQNLPPRRCRSDSKRLMHGIASGYRALGWTCTDSRSAALKSRDLCVLRRLRSKWAMKMGMQNNKLQHHFRPQVVF